MHTSTFHQDFLQLIFQQGASALLRPPLKPRMGVILYNGIIEYPLIYQSVNKHSVLNRIIKFIGTLEIIQVYYLA